jgi:hypothetical protein
VNDKELNLKVTIKVKSGTADGAAAALRRSLLRKAGSVRIGLAEFWTLTGTGVEVTSIERADGEPLGLKTEFEEYWSNANCEEDDEVDDNLMWSYAKVSAWGAFQAAYDIYGKDRRS